jgi:hypothetical protein
MNICVTNDNIYVPLVVITILSFPHCSCLIMLHCNKSNMTDASSGAGTAYPSRELQFTLFLEILVVFAQSLIFCILSLYCFSFSHIMLSVLLLFPVILRYTTSDYPINQP